MPSHHTGLTAMTELWPTVLWYWVWAYFWVLSPMLMVMLAITDISTPVEDGIAGALCSTEPVRSPFASKAVIFTSREESRYSL